MVDPATDLLMDALARRDPTETAKPGAAQVVNKPRAPVIDKPMASKCIKIENAFDPDEEQKAWGNNWVEELEALLVEMEIEKEPDTKKASRKRKRRSMSSCKRTSRASSGMALPSWHVDRGVWPCIESLESGGKKVRIDRPESGSAP
ncbi:hypothetical protein C7974DRAFT_469782 [Boeremia exigua]|uniref:uncharacterized protein n=1 Tax=Boeremia exigua TaxID=749465 RepID=UPI001E8CB2B1|nr:uncharacterized protein C7974DRAFT_469782 [Boeremia exigua]KAH6639216.1 hypothetical protein C7974DRAFT_469782 [Boeremia exigua]